MEQKQQQERGEQRRQGQQQQQQVQLHQQQQVQLKQQLLGTEETTGNCHVPVTLSGRPRLADCAAPIAASSYDCALDAGANSLCSGTLLFWAEAAAAVTAPSEPLSCTQEAARGPNESGGTRQSATPTCRVNVKTGSALSFHTVLQQHLLQRQQRHTGASSSPLLRHVLLAAEESAAFFSPVRLPLLLCLCSRSIPTAQQEQQRPTQKPLSCEVLSSGDSLYGSVSALTATTEEGKATKTTRLAAPAGAIIPEGCLLLSFLWVLASWFSRLADPLPVSAAAAAADLGLCCTTSARAAALAATDPSAAAAVTALAGGFPALQERAKAVSSTAVAAAASLRGGICDRLAALRALAYWCCCCTLAKQEGMQNVQRNRMRQQQRQPLALHAAPPRISSSEMKRENSGTSSSLALLRQLQQECRESFAQLLLQQQDAQQQLAERQGIEMECACALREKQEQALKAAIAARCLPVQDSTDSKNSTAAAVASSALEACERDLQELVQQHLSECELLGRHWIHEQQLMRKQQLRMFKNVAADLYVLQHGSAAVYGAACQELVLPPLPSADETERWAFNWKQRQKEQGRQEQPMQEQQQPPSRRQVGVTARQLFRRHGGSPSQEGGSLLDASSSSDSVSAAAGEATAAKEERLGSYGAAAAHAGSAAAAAAATSAFMGTPGAAGQNKLQQQEQQNKQPVITACTENSSSQSGGAQRQQTAQQKQQQQKQKQHVLQSSSTGFTANAAHSQRHRQHQRQLAVAAAAHQGPVFDMPRLLQGIAAGAMQPQQRRTSGVPQQHQQPWQLGGVQEHAEVRLTFGAQQRRTLWLHVCTGLTADFFPSSAASPPEQQNQQQGGLTVSCAAKWLSWLGQGATAFPEEQLADWPGGSSSYCYKDARHMRGSTLSCFVGSSGRPSCGELLTGQEPEGPSEDLFAALKSGPRASLSGAILPTGAAMQESCACIKAGNDTSDLLLPSLEEQQRLLRAAMHAVRRSSNCLGSKQRLLLQQGEVFVSRHAARLRPQVCFHLAVASAGLSHEASQPSSPLAAAQSAEAPVEHDGNKRRNSAGDDLDSLCAPVCEGLRQILRLCEKHAVGALLLPALLLETEASASCLPFAVLQRRMLAVLRCVVAELRAISLSPASNGYSSSDAAVGRLRHLVLLLPPIQQQQQEGSGQMNLLVQAAVNFLRNSACCC
ncbi:hypothetical protein, conserved [Eimeria acervulina]|uniref:Uncharacterized protein n=1 Tax=Eimeria acervulina TaxID=5801 RepID=U6GQX5_EIMAC|nr:hypothetical protein, conserved [Eimeria acervulina]CDI81982.1 hypothetical protein, conserved [Eimeria acervulina]